ATSFYDINEQTLIASKRSFSVEQKTQHDIDHPIGFTEGAYLKCGYYRFLD
ncbi:MAG: 23S rRNA (cytosine1962-C5)-methyltransferase, partial [Psychroserpens sp.]